MGEWVGGFSSWSRHKACLLIFVSRSFHSVYLCNLQKKRDNYTGGWSLGSSKEGLWRLTFPCRPRELRFRWLCWLLASIGLAPTICLVQIFYIVPFLIIYQEQEIQWNPVFNEETWKRQALSAEGVWASDSISLNFFTCVNRAWISLPVLTELCIYLISIITMAKSPSWCTKKRRIRRGTQKENFGSRYILMNTAHPRQT